jgi:hypothetical protein
MRVSTFKNDREPTRSPMFQLPHKLSKTRCQESVFDLGVVLTTAPHPNLKDTKYAKIFPCARTLGTLQNSVAARHSPSVPHLYLQFNSTYSQKIEMHDISSEIFLS